MLYFFTPVRLLPQANGLGRENCYEQFSPLFILYRYIGASSIEMNKESSCVCICKQTPRANRIAHLFFLKIP